jgi:hypothetical protein
MTALDVKELVFHIQIQGKSAEHVEVLVSTQQIAITVEAQDF